MAGRGETAMTLGLGCSEGERAPSSWTSRTKLTAGKGGATDAAGLALCAGRWFAEGARRLPKSGAMFARAGDKWSAAVWRIRLHEGVAGVRVGR